LVDTDNGEAIDDDAAARNDVTGNQQDAIAVRQPLDKRHFTAQPVVGALEPSHMRWRGRSVAGNIEQAAQSVKDREHAPSYKPQR
jgi:hypothetical protein